MTPESFYPPYARDDVYARARRGEQLAQWEWRNAEVLLNGRRYRYRYNENRYATPPEHRFLIEWTSEGGQPISVSVPAAQYSWNDLRVGVGHSSTGVGYAFADTNEIDHERLRAEVEQMFDDFSVAVGRDVDVEEARNERHAATQRQTLDSI